MKASWRTTVNGGIVLGLGVGLLITLLILKSDNVVAWGAAGALVPAGLGLMQARDHKVTSERAGAH